MDADFERATRLASGDHGPTVVGDSETDTLTEHGAQSTLQLLAGPLVNKEVWRGREGLVTGVLLEGLRYANRGPSQARGTDETGR
jgi:hypothetical protein